MYAICRNSHLPNLWTEMMLKRCKSLWRKQLKVSGCGLDATPTTTASARESTMPTELHMSITGCHGNIHSQVIVRG